MKKIVIIALCAIQLLVPATMIYQYETTLSHGQAHRFKVVPIDPADPFRGRFVRLRFDAEIIDRDKGVLGEEMLPKGKSQAFVLLETDDEGLAYVSAVSIDRPNNGAYLKANVRVYGNKLYSIDFPIDRYYAEESKAPDIEKVVFGNRGIEEAQIDSVVAQVNIKNGRGVIAELFVGEQTIDQYLQN